MFFKIILISFFIFTAGCRNIPFKETELVPLNNIKNTDKIFTDFNKKLPEDFTVLNSLVFDYYFHSFSSLGICKANLNTDDITVIGINQMGFKLFEISEKQGKIKVVFSIDQFKEYEKLPQTIISDIRKIFFNRISSKNANIAKEKYKIKFTVPYKKGLLRYTFAGNPLNLINKIYFENGKEKWKVSYFEYTLKNNKYYPGGIILENMQYNYSLIIKLRKILN